MKTLIVLIVLMLIPVTAYDYTCIVRSYQIDDALYYNYVKDGNLYEKVYCEDL